MLLEWQPRPCPLVLGYVCMHPMFIWRQFLCFSLVASYFLPHCIWISLCDCVHIWASIYPIRACGLFLPYLVYCGGFVWQGIANILGHDTLQHHFLFRSRFLFQLGEEHNHVILKISSIRVANILAFGVCIAWFSITTCFWRYVQWCWSLHYVQIWCHLQS